jgi:endonuclease/exonuclease/phosphatase family metal-dependent hydrolase
LRVVTFNVAGGRFGLPRVIRTLRRLDADLVGLQEVLGPPDGQTPGQARRLGEALGMHAVFQTHGYGGHPAQGVALLSRWPLRSARARALPPGPRRVLQAQVAIDRWHLTVLVAHLRAVGVAVGARRRRYVRARRREVRLLHAQLRRLRGPALLLADLNASADSPALRGFGPPLRDVCRGSGGAGRRSPGNTWPSGFPLLRLDYIFASAHLQALRCRAVPSDASDHRPVVAELRWVAPPRR